MNKTSNIKQVLWLALLLVYVYGNTPVLLLFHHHAKHSVEYTCDSGNAVFQKINAENSNQNSHISSTVERCYFCDHHIFIVHLLSRPFKSFLSSKKSYNFLNYSSFSHNLSFFEVHKRGPPHF